MAGVLVLLVFVDTALTGWLLAQVQQFKRVLAVVGEIQQTHTGELDLLRDSVDLSEGLEDA